MDTAIAGVCGSDGSCCHESLMGYLRLRFVRPDRIAAAFAGTSEKRRRHFDHSVRASMLRFTSHDER